MTCKGKILILSDARSIHTKRWVTALINRGFDILLYSINPPSDDYFEREGVKAFYFNLFKYKEKRGIGRAYGMLSSHFAAVRDLRRVLKREKPDILHAHYLTSYSLIAALCGFKPLILSVWGSDIYSFTKESFIKRICVKFMLRRADRILSTSNVMARECAKYTGKKIDITPFGVDTGLFKPIEKEQSRFVVGTVKILSHKYGIDLTIRSFCEFCRKNPDMDAELVIAGTGPDTEKLRSLASSLGIAKKVIFKGYVPNGRIPELMAEFSVAVFLSRKESFGVAAIEAMSCGKPVITSAAPGFTEVVSDNECGFIIKAESEERVVELCGETMEKLAYDRELGRKMGEAGRKRVKTLYDWQDNVSIMERIYQQTITGDKRD